MADTLLPALAEQIAFWEDESMYQVEIMAMPTVRRGSELWKLANKAKNIADTYARELRRAVAEIGSLRAPAPPRAPQEGTK